MNPGKMNRRRGLLRIALPACALAVVVILFVSTGAIAQPAAEEPANGSASRLFDHFVVSGGVITWFVLIPLSIATIALIVEHSFSIRRKVILPADTLQRIRTDLEAKRYVDAMNFTAGEPSVLGCAMNSGLSQAGNGYLAMQRAMTEVVEHRAGRMMRKIEYLNVIGNVSPMIGLFGTVVGMIRLFASITEAGGIPEPAKIADDISIALVTTFWGLLVAIPALGVFAFFRNRIDGLATECAAAAEKLLSAFAPPNDTAERAAPAPENQVAP